MLGQIFSDNSLDLPNHISPELPKGSAPGCKPEGLHVRGILVFLHAIKPSSPWQ